MSSSTISARQSQTVAHRTAADLHELADLIAAGHVPEQVGPNEPWTLVQSSASALAVREFAARMGVDSYQLATERDVRTTADLMLGEGSVLLHLVHIAPKAA